MRLPWGGAQGLYASRANAPSRIPQAGSSSCRSLSRPDPGRSTLRAAQLPILLGIPFGLTIETIPTHLPLPAKIRTELLDPIPVEKDPERVNDREYVSSIYLEVESAIQQAMARLAKQRRFPIFG
jgi:hypothetical protein